MQWLDYLNKGIKPTRVKLSAVVYSDQAIKKPVSFKLNDFEITLLPLSCLDNHTKEQGGFMPAFRCETITDIAHHQDGGAFDISNCLDRLLPVLGFRYLLAMGFDKWEEYEGNWLKLPIALSASISQLSIFTELPKPNIHELIEAYEKLALRDDKRSKKAAKVRMRLKEALDLERVSPRFSFLSYYSIIEIISDDLAANKDVPSNNSIAVEMAKHSLSTKGSQRTKIYFLLLAFENAFDLDQQIALSDTRNDLAHGQFELNPLWVSRCKELAVWASENYVLHLAANIK